METSVFLLVLVAAAAHAGWNALLKLRVEPIVGISLISVACGVMVVPLLPFIELPVPQVWPFVLASLGLHFVYYLALAEAYRTGELGQIYPIARGTAPLITAVATTFIFAERITPTAWLGITVLACGILLLAVMGGRLDHMNRRAIGFALLTSASISAYTMVDGLGARAGSSAGVYIVWLILLDGIMMLTFGLLLRGGSFVEACKASWPTVLAAATMSGASYAIAIWAMTVAPIALVAAVRETSVLFAVLLSVLLLREPARPARMAAVLVAFAGVMLLRAS